MTDKKVMQQALEALKGLFGTPENWESGGVVVWRLGGSGAPRKAITALEAALEQPEQEPTPWRDMVVVSLVREGVNKHKARELADHFVNFTLTPPLPVQRKPLDEWVIDRFANNIRTADPVTWWRQLARDVENAHNIKEQS